MLSATGKPLLSLRGSTSLLLSLLLLSSSLPMYAAAVDTASAGTVQGLVFHEGLDLSAVNIIAAILFVLIGLICAFTGYRNKRITIFVSSLTACFFVLGAVMDQFVLQNTSIWHPSIPLMYGFVFAASLVVALCMTCCGAFIWLVGGAAGAVVGLFVMGYITGIPQFVKYIVIAVMFMIGVVLMLYVERLVIVPVTAILGGAFVMFGLEAVLGTGLFKTMLLGRTDAILTASPALLAVALSGGLVAIVGLLCQLLSIFMSKRSRRQQKNFMDV